MASYRINRERLPARETRRERTKRTAAMRAAIPEISEKKIKPETVKHPVIRPFTDQTTSLAEKRLKQGKGKDKQKTPRYEKDKKQTQDERVEQMRKASAQIRELKKNGPKTYAQVLEEYRDQGLVPVKIDYGVKFIKNLKK